MTRRERKRSGYVLWLRVGTIAAALASGVAAVGHAAGVDDRIEELRNELQREVSSNGWRMARYSVLALSLDTGDTLFAENPRDRLEPASNMKLLTTSTALRFLGPDFHYQTFLLSAAPIQGGHLKGDLVLYGTGDPGLEEDFQGTNDFDELADSLAAAGVTAVDGALIGDGTFFTGPLRAEGWNPADMNDWFTAASSGLGYDENMVTLRVMPGEPGQPPAVHTIPDGADLPMTVTAVTGADGPRVTIRRDDPMEPIAIDGTVASGGREIWRQMTVPEPSHFAASVFRTVLESKGIEVAGGVKTVADAASSGVSAKHLFAPAVREERRGPRVIAHHQSGPILDYLRIINKKSHNFFADHTLKTVGRIVSGDGSFAGGANVVRHFLATEVKSDTTDLVQLDGSGLSVENRISAATFVDVLRHMSRTKMWDDWVETLPEAGNPHELRRMYQTAAAGNLRAKTGTIDHVSALSGIVRSANGERILFSIIANDVPTTYGAKRIEDRIGATLASFERPFTASEAAELAADTLTDTTAVWATPPAPNTATARAPTPQAQPPVATGQAPTPQSQSPVATGPAQPAVQPPAAKPTPVQPTARTHVVQKGENLTTIATKYGVSLNALVAANPKTSPRRIHAGVKLTIPAPEAGGAPTERQDVQVHEVKAGDSFSTIARTYDVSVNALIQANPDVNPKRLQPGQKIRIPAASQG